MSELTDPADTLNSPTHASSPNEPHSDPEYPVRKRESPTDNLPALPVREDEIADRVLAKLATIANQSREAVDPARVLVLNTAPHATTLTLAAPPPPQGAVLNPPDPPQDSPRGWFLLQLIGEARLLVRMYFDPRYRISRTTQFAVPAIGLILIFNYFFFSQWFSILFLSPIAERVLLIVLGIVGYKLLTRELVRYRAVLDYLNKYAPR
jgi:hypothetical protein